MNEIRRGKEERGGVAADWVGTEGVDAGRGGYAEGMARYGV